MYIFNPTLKSLREKLNVKLINTGRKLLNSYGMVSDDIERLYPVIGADGRVYFKSGTEFSSIQYRGQNEDYGVCKTTLDRLDSKEKQFLSICQTIAFEELLENHPFIKFTRSIKFFNNPLNLNLTGISQHYGLHTNYLDITNNFDVACFFATCKYEDGKYYPIGNIKKAGVIYQIIEPKFNSLNDIEVEYLGWQPLPRPEEQRASVLKIDKNIDINTVKGIQKYYFKHSISQSKKIWKQFDEGRILFPEDSASNLANECKKLNSFTSNQINKAFDKFEFWSGNKLQNREQILDYLKINIIENNGLSWDDLVEIKQEYWKKKFDESMRKVGFRFASEHFESD